MTRKIVSIKIDARFKRVLEEKSRDLDIPIISLTTMLAFQMKEGRNMFHIEQKGVGRKRKVRVSEPEGFSLFKI